MSVKSFLRELIKDGSGQAMPGIKVVNIDNSAPTYVAPADGYARFSCRANGVNDWWVVRTPENNLEGGFAAPGASHQQAPWIPVKKGATISFGTSEGVPVTSKVPPLDLYAGGLPCLKTSCAKPSQLISEISERGYLSKAFQNSRSNTHPSSRQTAMTTGAGSTRLQMVGSLFNSTNTDSLWTLRTRREELPFASPRSEGMGPSRRSCRQGKETRSRTTCSQQSHLLRTREWFSTAVSEHQASNNSFMEVAA